MPTVAYRAVRSRRKFLKVPEIRKDLESSIDGIVKPKFLGEFNNIVSSWNNKPEFKARKFLKPDSISLDVYPSGESAEIWGYVSGGTKPHAIEPHGNYPLSFKWGGPGSYKAKTGPRGYYKGPGKVIGGKQVAFRVVHHPGNKARNFPTIIRNRNQKWFNRTMENAWRRAIRRA